MWDVLLLFVQRTASLFMYKCVVCVLFKSGFYYLQQHTHIRVNKIEEVAWRDAIVFIENRTHNSLYVYAHCTYKCVLHTITITSQRFDIYTIEKINIFCIVLCEAIANIFININKMQTFLFFNWNFWFYILLLCVILYR